jgi:hypothetical protein
VKKFGNLGKDRAMDFFRCLVRPALMAAALTSGCGSNPEGDTSRPDGAPGEEGAADSGSQAESGESTDSSSISNDGGSVDSGSIHTGSTDSGSIHTGSADSGSIDASSTDAGSIDASSTGLDGGGSEDANQDGSALADSGVDVPATFFVRYEAESPVNTRTYPVEGVATEGATPCPGIAGTSSDGVKEGANCASGGHAVNQILGRSPCTPATSTTSYTDCGDKGGGVTFNEVTVPVDGTYDVTFWYHSGQETPGHADVYGDVNCGGHSYDTGPGSGCRPHLIYVDGVQMSSTVGGQSAVYYEFPAYPDSWSIIHGAVTALPLKAGSNTIYIKAPGFTTSDAADIDAIDIQPSGQGAPLFQSSGQGGPPAQRMGLITPVVNWN